MSNIDTPSLGPGEMIRRYALVSIGALVLVLGLVTLLVGGDDIDPQEAEQAVAQLNADRVTAEDELEESYAELAGSIPGLDQERVARDEQAGRSLILTLAGTSASAQPLVRQQTQLLKRWDFLAPDSDTITRFLPEFHEAVAPQRLRMEQFDLQVLSVQGLDYTYLGFALLVPSDLDAESVDDADDVAEAELVVLRYSTRQDGEVIWLDATRGSSSARDLVATEVFGLDADPASGATDSAVDQPDSNNDDSNEGEQ